MASVLRFQCSDEMKAQVDAYCAERGVKFSKWVRWLILNEIEGCRQEWGREEFYSLTEANALDAKRLAAEPEAVNLKPVEESVEPIEEEFWNLFAGADAA